MLSCPEDSGFTVY
jgi:hypothetical protein